MNLVEKALIFAAKAHHGQVRKGTDIPYITHPVAVGMILQKASCSDEVVAAGILHDTLEDTETTYDDLVSAFGAYVADLVVAASETDKTLSWEDRKRQTISMLKHTTTEEMHVIVADKLHNLQSIHHDLKTYGPEIWDRFNRGKNEQHWYYRSIIDALLSRTNEFKLIETLNEEVHKVFDENSNE